MTITASSERAGKCRFRAPAGVASDPAAQVWICACPHSRHERGRSCVDREDCPIAKKQLRIFAEAERRAALRRTRYQFPADSDPIKDLFE